MTPPLDPNAEAPDFEQRVMAKVLRRIIPFVLCCYVASYIDRVNVGFAAIQMNKDLHLTPTTFGLGAGLFFIGYFLCEVPSNLMLLRVGARRWIARIMMTWGAICVLTAFAQGSWSFGAARLLLGVAEAGFTPGIYLFFTFWFPGAWRAKATAAFLVGIPLANMLGAPLSGLLLTLDGLGGLRGWQWLFILEGAPAIVLGALCLRVLIDSPEQASWLEPDERSWLAQRIAAEQKDLAGRHGDAIRGGFAPRVFLYALINFCGIVGSLGVGIWMPLIVARFGLSPLATGFTSALPYAVGAISMTLWSRAARESVHRLGFVLAALAVAATGLAASAFAGTPVAALAALVVAVSGILSFQATFWALPSTFLTGRAAAAGLALIVSLGNLGGFVGPFVVGALRQSTGGFTAPLLFLSSALVLAAVVMALVGDPEYARRRKSAAASEVAA